MLGKTIVGHIHGIAAAQKGADHTASLSKARAGRSSYVPDAALKGVPDPGATAIAKMLASL